jgi:PAS domain S-box-containing protein
MSSEAAAFGRSSGLPFFAESEQARVVWAHSTAGASPGCRNLRRVVEGLDEMIVVLDRNYRYLIANHAFLQYRGMKREDLIGRRIPEILNPGVFEAVIKGRLDECLCGKIVQFEMRYRYPNRENGTWTFRTFPSKDPAGLIGLPVW